MTPSILLSILAGIVLFVFVSYRQTQFSRLNLAKAARMPLLLLVVGLVVGAQTFDSFASLRTSPADVALLVGEAALAAVSGWAMGRMTQVGMVDGVLSSRLRPIGLAVWFGYVLLRVLGSAVAHVDHLSLASSLPLLFVMLAVVKGTQAAVVWSRIEHADAGSEAESARA